MTAPTVKPGTRCECDGSCQNKPHTFECADAVRTVVLKTGEYSCGQPVYKHTAYCEACADYVERVK